MWSSVLLWLDCGAIKSTERIGNCDEPNYHVIKYHLSRWENKRFRSSHENLIWTLWRLTYFICATFSPIRSVPAGELNHICTHMRCYRYRHPFHVRPRKIPYVMYCAVPTFWPFHVCTISPNYSTVLRRQMPHIISHTHTQSRPQWNHSGFPDRSTFCCQRRNGCVRFVDTIRERSNGYMLFEKVFWLRIRLAR